MFLKLKPSEGQPLYVQLIQQIRHAAEIGALKDGDQLPGIRSLAEQVLVSPNTVVKAYSELEHEGLLELRHGTGAFLCIKRRSRTLADRVSGGRKQIGLVVRDLRNQGLKDEEIRRIFEAELLSPTEVECAKSR